MKTKKKSGEDQQKKVFAPNWSVFFPEIRWSPKKIKIKKVFTAIRGYIRSEFVGFIRTGWLLFRLIIQRSNLDGGTLNLDGETRPPTI